MTYAYYHEVKKGLTPPAAPSYVEPQAEKKVPTCLLCGYRYEGEVPFEQLPDDWTCPVCGAAKEMFVLK